MASPSSRGPSTAIIIVLAVVAAGGIGYYVGHRGSASAISAGGMGGSAANGAIVAKANGAPIYQSEVDILTTEVGEQARQIPPADLQARIVDRLIDLKLALAKAESEKIPQEPAIAQKLQLGQTSTIADAYLERTARARINDAILKAKYDELVKQVTPVEEVRARHILVKTEAEAKDIIKQLDKGGDFEKLAKDKSTDPGSGESGGDLGYFTKDKMVPEFADAAFKMEKGKYSETPVHTQYGWHVIQVLDKRAQPLPAFDQVKPQLTALVLQDQERQVIEDLHKDAKIERFNLDGTPLVTPPAAAPAAPAAAAAPTPAPAPAPAPVAEPATPATPPASKPAK
jgi:peptidyl-prolyl cis-trans isomerase C